MQTTGPEIGVGLEIAIMFKEKREALIIDVYTHTQVYMQRLVNMDVYVQAHSLYLSVSRTNSPCIDTTANGQLNAYGSITLGEALRGM